MYKVKINELINNKKSYLTANNINISSTKDMQYGIKFFFEKNNENCVLVIYFSQKKGFSFVFESTSSYNNLLLEIFSGEVVYDNEKQINFEKYAGMDESGKGDFFGPLVCAGFYANEKIKKELFKIGVKDCKKLSDKQVLDIYENIKTLFPKNYKFIALYPEEYNKIYNDLNKIGKKLNFLLGKVYAQIINEFEVGEYEVDGYIIDKFGDEKNITDNLNNKKINLNLFIKGEDDIAVAAASVVARAEFINGIKKLSHKAGFEIPLGAGSNVDIAAKRILEEKGFENLSSFLKLHFKNFDKIK